MEEKRGFKFGTYDPNVLGFGWKYDTALEGWTLTGWEFPEPELIENYIDVPGRIDGPLDASTALTNGDPRYGKRKLTATFERSDATRGHRTNYITTIRTRLHGHRFDIAFPDSGVTATLHAKGRVSVETLYNDLAHASVRVTAICDPWRYSNLEEEVNLTAGANDTLETDIVNDGGRTVVPTIEVLEGSTGLSGRGDGGLHGAPHTLSYIALSTGTYHLPDFYLLPYEKFTLKYTGTCRIKITYREAVL